MKQGQVYLVGAGPGDPKLLTLRGKELLGLADVVVYDHLAAQAILTNCAPKVKVIYVGKQAKKHTRTQGEINRLLVRLAKAGKCVVRLKGGDPVLFGRGGEEALALSKAKVSFEIVPGVTSAIAVPAYAGIPVTHRTLASSVAFVTGHEDPAKSDTAIRFDKLSTACDTLVWLMGVKTLPGVVRELIRCGRSKNTPCAVIERGTTARQRSVTGSLTTIVSQVRRLGIKPPAIFVVGDVVALRRKLNWFETKPLFGTRILITRAYDKASSFADKLEALGAECEQLPVIELVPVKSDGVFRNAIKSLPSTDWVFFTSPEGIGWFSRMLKRSRQDVRSLGPCRVGAIGPKTAMAIEEAGLRVDFIPKKFSQEGMIDCLPRSLIKGKRAIIFSAAGSRDVLETGLRRRGMHARRIPIYRTVVPQALRKGISGTFERPFDLVSATSASCADNLSGALRAAARTSQFRNLRFASIGPITSRAIRAHGAKVVVEAKNSTIDGLVDAIIHHSRGARHATGKRGGTIHGSS